MKLFHKFWIACACMFIAAASLSSCDWDTSPDYDHPTYVTYSVTATDVSFTGPEQLLLDIQAWIEANQFIKDIKIEHPTGGDSDYVSSDAEVIRKYEAFASKFKAYLNDLKGKLEADKYGSGTKVISQFAISATRMQGNDRTLRQETVDFVYP